MIRNLTTLVLSAWNSATQSRYQATGEVDRYGRVNRHSPSLFGDDGNAKWITIGGEPGPDGKKHGGHHVQIDKEGTMLTGKFAGQKLGEAFGHQGKDKPETDYGKRLEDMQKRKDPDGIAGNDESDRVGRSMGAMAEEGARQTAIESPDSEARANAIQRGLASVSRLPHVKTATAAQVEMRSFDAWSHLKNNERAQFSGHKEFGAEVGKAWQAQQQGGGLKPLPQHDDEKSQLMAELENAEGMGGWTHASKIRAELDAKHPGWDDENMGVGDTAPDQPASIDSLRQRQKELDAQRDAINEQINPLVQAESAHSKKLQSIREQLQSMRGNPLGMSYEDDAEAKQLRRDQTRTKALADKARAQIDPLNEQWRNLHAESQQILAQIRTLEQQGANAGQKPFQPIADDSNKPAAPGFLEQAKPLGNEEANAGDQLGLFGEATRKPSPKPKMAGDPKAKQGGLFDTRGNADQMDLFGDGVMPDDMVFKPQPKANADADAEAVANMAPGAIKRSERDRAASEEGLNQAEENRRWAENHITIAADDISRLRKQDVYRVLENAPSDKRGYLENWIQKRRPDLAEQVNLDSQDIDEERANAAASKPQPKPFQPIADDANSKKKDEAIGAESEALEGTGQFNPHSIRGYTFGVSGTHRVLPVMGLNNRRLSAARRALKRERDKAPLFADAIAAEQPTPEERIKKFDDAAEVALKEEAERRKKQWEALAKEIESLPPSERENFVSHWNSSAVPDNEAYLAGHLSKFKREGLPTQIARPEIANPETRAKVEKLEKAKATLQDIHDRATAESGKAYAKQRLSEVQAEIDSLVGNTAALNDAAASKAFAPIADDANKMEEAKAIGEPPKTIPLRERKNVATQLATEGKTEAEIVDHLSTRGVALVDARKLAAEASGGGAKPAAKPVPPVQMPKPNEATDNKPSEPPSPPKPQETPAAKAAASHQEAIERGDSPRQAAQAAQREIDADYEFARASAIRNAGEDLKGSARHKVNAWKTLEEAEKDGTASELVARDHLLRNEPHNLMVHADKNPVASLAMHLAMKAFPAKPGTKGTANAKKDREQYLEAYRSVKQKAEELAKTHDSGEAAQAIGELQKHVASLIKKYRGQTASGSMGEATASDKYNQTANDLVDLHRALETGWRARKTGIATRIEEFAKLAKERYGDNALAMEEVAEHAKDIMDGHSLNKTFGKEGKSQSRFNPAEVYVKHAKRSGGRDVSNIVADPNKATKHMVESFGVRGVQWGNTVSDEERKHHAARTVEALTDLADVTGLHPKDIALNGKLGLAIGARGKGNASAHYEPGTQVINLTRASGVGALAHEWGHAFDHMVNDFGAPRKGMDSKRNSVAYMSSDHDYTHEMVEPSGRRWKVQSNSGKVPEGWKLEELPKLGLRKAYTKWWAASRGFRDRLHDELQVAVKNGRVSAAKAKGYWNSNHEIFARAFERHVQHKLEQDGRENTYLSGFAGNSPLWPSKAESKDMEAAFDGIFEEYRKHAHGSPERIKYSKRAESTRMFHELIESECDRYSDDCLFYDEAAENRARELYHAVQEAWVDRYEWREQDHPRKPKGAERGGQFTSKQREIVERPKLAGHHSLHVANQDNRLRLQLSDWAKGLNRLLANSHRMQGGGSNVTEEQLWQGVDKNALRQHLDYMNQLDKQSRQNGGPDIAAIVNANGLLPKMIAERLHGGSRFFDPTKLRGKWHEPAPKPQKPSEPAAQPAASQKESSPQPSQQQSESEPEPEDNGGLSKQKLKWLNKAIESLVGTNEEMQSDFRKLVIEAWKQKKEEAAMHNEAIRHATGTAAKMSDAHSGARTPQSLGHLVKAARNRTLDPSTKRGFDQMVDAMEKQFPHLIAGKGEEGLMDILAEGIKQEPDVMDEDVVNLAMSMAGPGFFGSHDDGETFEDADATNFDHVPFSWLSAKAQVEVMRYANNHWSDQIRDELGQWAKDGIPEVKIPKQSGIQLARFLMDSFGKSLLGKKIKNKDTGWEIQIDRNTVRKIAGRGDPSAYGLAVLPELLRDGKLLSSAAGEGSEDLVQVHQFCCPAIIHGSVHAVKITVRELKEHGHRAYSLHAVEIKKDSPQKPATGNKPADPTLGESSVSNIDNALEKIKRGNDYYSVFSEHDTEELEKRARRYSSRSHAMHAAKPTESQSKAGNYRMAHISVHGIPITIETPKGRRRNLTGVAGQS